MTYWIPPALPLPRGTRNLFWHKTPPDQGAAWFWNKRLYLMPRGKNAVEGADPYTLSEQELSGLRLVRSAGYRSENWMRNPTAFGERHLSRYSDFIPIHTLPEGFFVLALPFIDATHYHFEDPDQNAKSFLIGRSVGQRFQIYPRTLRARGWQSKAGTILKARSITALAASWTKGFDALPAWAAKPEDVRAGLPTLAATVSGRDVYEEMDAEAHPYWRNAANALIAALSLAGVRPPFPEQTYYRRFHWTVYSPRFDSAKNPEYQALPLSVELPYDGYALSTDRDIKTPTHDEAKALKRVSDALTIVLNRFAPDEPLFFDTLGCNSSMVKRISTFNDSDFSKLHHFSGTGQHFPWIRGEDMESVGTAHGALRALGNLPPSWREALTAALATSKT